MAQRPVMMLGTASDMRIDTLVADDLPASLNAPGSTTQVLFNNAGAIAGNAAFLFDSANVKVTIDGKLELLQGGTVSTPSSYGGQFYVTTATESGDQIIYVMMRRDDGKDLILSSYNNGSVA